mmetsp:Transcript_3930/g.15661  ORF Transcript_3930/g.15661 Transcript_3930/m.15661 type:complete len:267 (-) Transcript_3930:361-1161(-)
MIHHRRDDATLSGAPQRPCGIRRRYYHGLSGLGGRGGGAPGAERAGPAADDDGRPADESVGWRGVGVRDEADGAREDDADDGREDGAEERVDDGEGRERDSRDEREREDGEAERDATRLGEREARRPVGDEVALGLGVRVAREDRRGLVVSTTALFRDIIIPGSRRRRPRRRRQDAARAAELEELLDAEGDGLELERELGERRDGDEALAEDARRPVDEADVDGDLVRHRVAEERVARARDDEAAHEGDDVRRVDDGVPVALGMLE